MQYIDEKFKEEKPENTVKKIKGILDELGIEVYEKWTDSGLDNCFSLSLHAKGGIPSSNGKGITKDLARASAYGEFIERLQGGLFFYKFQSIVRVPDMNLQSFAPDAKYMTITELTENGEWMDYLINEYKKLSLTREKIAQHCRMYACADEEKILTLPFYSLFENKYVYLPIDFVDHIYATNGCCVGNSREEAWVHALSEIMERHANLNIFTSGNSAPNFPLEMIDKYPIVSKIVNQIRKSGEFDIDIFDYSLDDDFPIVSTRIINKKTHSYKVNVAADPVFEIALQRTLTELFQGKNLNDFTSHHNGTVLNRINDFPIISNIINQLETGNGLYTVDYFSNEITCNKSVKQFRDNSNKNNAELLNILLQIFKKKNKQIYVRNFSYLGFPCYRFVVPGFSEALVLKLSEPIPEFSVADKVCSYFRNPISATDADLNWLLVYSNMIKSTFSRYNFFARIAGVPISGKINSFLTSVTRAYASFRLKSYDNAIKYLNSALESCDDAKTIEYFVCINKYVEFLKMGVSEAKIHAILNKFFIKDIVDKLYSNIGNGKTPYDEFLLNCSFNNCENCKYNEFCCYNNTKRINKIVGNIYNSFVKGQDESEFLTTIKS